MIITEPLDNRERRYSDQNVKLRQLETGNLYSDAVDVAPCLYTYEETDIEIPEPPDVRAGPASSRAALETRIAALENANATLETANATLENANAALETEKAALETEKAALETEKAALTLQLTGGGAEDSGSRKGRL